MLRIVCLTCVFFSQVFLITSCSNNDTPDKTDLRFMSGEQSGAWPALAIGITEIMKKEVPALGNVSILPGGGISNVVGVDSGQAHVGFSQAASIVDAVNGVEPFKSKAVNFSYILSLFHHKTHIVVLEKSGIQAIDDIRGKRINVGATGLLSEVIAKRILDIHGMTYQDMASVQNLSFSDSVVQMKDSRLDVLFWTVPAPFAVITDLTQSMDIKLIPLPEDTIEKLIIENKGIHVSSIDGGTYRGINHSVTTIQSPLVIIANNHAPEDIIYSMAKIVSENLEYLANISPNLKGLSIDNLIHDFDVPVHPGAERYFKESALAE